MGPAIAAIHEHSTRWAARDHEVCVCLRGTGRRPGGFHGRRQEQCGRGLEPQSGLAF